MLRRYQERRRGPLRNRGADDDIEAVQASRHTCLGDRAAMRTATKQPRVAEREEQPTMTATTSTSAATRTVDVRDHLAAAAYLIKHRAVSVLVVVRGDRMVGIISEADLATAAARGTDLERNRVGQLVSQLPPGCQLTCD
jgi:CBS-domain-containing membrane protein